MIKVKNLSKKYGRVKAVSGLSFEVPKGEIVGLLGPNGAGKTTTMRMLTGYIPPSSGGAALGGYDILEQSLQIRKIVGYMPETVPLYNEMRVKEYLKFRARLKGIPRAECKERIDKVIEQCWLGDVNKRIIGQLSKGYRQRLGLASTLIHNPPILILDEPTIGLDPHQIRQIRMLIKDLGKDHTVLLSTHILPEVEMVCNRVIIINKGSLVAMDTTSNLARLLKLNKALSLLIKSSGPEIEKAFRMIPDVKIDQIRDEGENKRYHLEIITGRDIREEIFNIMIKNKAILLEMKYETPTLEDVFIKITTKEEKALQES
jgi:ABC-2 type transport system ATP-binding protein